MSFKCQECEKEFESLRGLHTHIKKHGVMLGDYYVRNYRRKNKLTGELLPFKNYKDYFRKDFSQPGQLEEWCNRSSKEEVEDYIEKLLADRIKYKNIDYGPTHLELISSDMPSIDIYKKYFGSYTEVCKRCGVEPLFSKNLPKDFFDDYSKVKILIDTREQKPLYFKNSEKYKLDVGDYSVEADNYDYTTVDRKSFGDFCGTVTSGYARFCKELDRCRSLGVYMFVVVEVPFNQMEDYNKNSYKKYKLGYVYHNMREIQKEYKDCCQFVFSGSRSNSIKLIPKLLVLGQKLWQTDVEYFWSKYINEES
ncbi:MAG: ERCC4 domain-containing protein [Flavobacteriaceae bacterium]